LHKIVKWLTIHSIAVLDVRRAFPARVKNAAPTNLADFAALEVRMRMIFDFRARARRRQTLRKTFKNKYFVLLQLNGACAVHVNGITILKVWKK
jgi:hypothetical protein